VSSARQAPPKESVPSPCQAREMTQLALSAMPPIARFPQKVDPEMLPIHRHKQLRLLQATAPPFPLALIPDGNRSFP
jgi:hypothetical protein